MIELFGKYTNAKIYADTIEEGVYGQVYDIINCPAFAGQSVVCMPDVHVGASGPCGLVATIGGYVCPEHIGVDIGCSVSAMILDKCIPIDMYARFEHQVKTRVPFGFNIHENTVIICKDFYKFLTTGFNKYRQKWPEMLNDLPNNVTEKWVAEQLNRLGMDDGRFYKSLGTVGGGNHFIEYNESVGVSNHAAAVVLHFGSRHFGVKVCKYWMGQSTKPFTKEELKEMMNSYKAEYLAENKTMKGFQEAKKKYLDKQSANHINGYLHGEKIKGYMRDMCFAQLYAQYNHMTVQRIISDILKKMNVSCVDTITSTHNFIDLEDHTLRKSAIRSYKGELMLVPFNMRDGVAICEGKSNSAWLNACAHGAGRIMSRSKAKQNISLEEFKDSMKDVYSTTVCYATIDESPMAYKNTDEIKTLIDDTCTIKYMMIPKINIKAADGGDDE